MRWYQSIVFVLCALCFFPASAHATRPAWQWPVESRDIASHFAPPDTAYAAGHRGIDLRAPVGASVRAVAPGRVVHAGQVGGVGTVSIEHDGERSTYQPVSPRVAKGDAVVAGQEIGHLHSTGHHCSTSCLHLGRVRGDQYLDPLEALERSRFILIDPDGPPPDPPQVMRGRLLRPVAGPVTSAFGMRVHPVTGEHKLHDGTDFGAACGAPVVAAEAGRVDSAGVAGAYGRRVDITHDDSMRTAYAHLQSISVQVGQTVRRGQRIGVVGSTGLSTGCHLHFMVISDGRPVAPY